MTRRAPWGGVRKPGRGKLEGPGATTSRAFGRVGGAVRRPAVGRTPSPRRPLPGGPARRRCPLSISPSRSVCSVARPATAAASSPDCRRRERGQLFCSPDCRRCERGHRHREANRRHARTPRARRHAARRQHHARSRRRAGVPRTPFVTEHQRPPDRLQRQCDRVGFADVQRERNHAIAHGHRRGFDPRDSWQQQRGRLVPLDLGPDRPGRRRPSSSAEPIPPRRSSEGEAAVPCRRRRSHAPRVGSPVEACLDVAGPEFVVFERQHLRGYRRREPARRRETLRFRGDEPRRARRCR